MKIMTVGDLKTRFSEILQEVQAGEEIAVAFGKKKKLLLISFQKQVVSLQNVL